MSRRDLHADALATLADWSPTEPDLEALRAAYVRFLAGAPDRVLRGGPEHLTASTLVLDAERTSALLTLHRKGGFWAQLGGHAEPGDATLTAAARREAVEESGIPDLELLPGPVDLDRHPLPGAFGACRVHWDVRYAAVAPAGAQARCGPESRELRWFPLDRLERGGQPPGATRASGVPIDLARLVRRSRAALVAAGAG